MEQPPPAAAPLPAPPSAPAPAPAVPSAQALASLIASSAAAAILEPPAPAPDAQAEPPKKKTPLTGLTHKVYVGNLPEITTLADLEDCFGQFGDCSCSLKRGFGFVDYKDASAAAEAVKQYHEGHFLGVQIKVELSHARSGAVPAPVNEEGKVIERNPPGSDRPSDSRKPMHINGPPGATRTRSLPAQNQGFYAPRGPPPRRDYDPYYAGPLPPRYDDYRSPYPDPRYARDFDPYARDYRGPPPVGYPMYDRSYDPYAGYPPYPAPGGYGPPPPLGDPSRSPYGAPPPASRHPYGPGPGEDLYHMRSPAGVPPFDPRESGPPIDRGRDGSPYGPPLMRIPHERPHDLAGPDRYDPRAAPGPAGARYSPYGRPEPDERNGYRSPRGQAPPKDGRRSMSPPTRRDFPPELPYRGPPASLPPLHYQPVAQGASYGADPTRAEFGMPLPPEGYVPPRR